MAAVLSLSPGLATGSSVVEITMQGRRDGSKVWFDPYGVLIQPGQTVRWTNKDKGNAHTATAYALDNYDHPRRIPEGAKPFDSDYLLPDESFEVTLDVPGLYDYFCIPHELSGMVGRIVVAATDQSRFAEYLDSGLDAEIIAGFPSVTDILARGSIHKDE